MLRHALKMPKHAIKKSDQRWNSDAKTINISLKGTDENEVRRKQTRSWRRKQNTSNEYTTALAHTYKAHAEFIYVQRRMWKWYAWKSKKKWVQRQRNEEKKNNNNNATQQIHFNTLKLLYKIGGKRWSELAIEHKNRLKNKKNSTCVCMELYDLGKSAEKMFFAL